MILTLELSKLTHSLLNRKMPTPKPSKYLKDSPGVPCHTQIRNCCSKHTRDNKHHCPKRDFPSAFWDFYRKPPKSPSFIRHISIQSSSFGSSSSSTSSRYSCSSVIPNFPVWSLLRIPAEPSIPTLLHQDSSAGTLGLHWGKALRFQTENATTSKIFLGFFFPPWYLGSPNLILQSFIRQQAEQTAQHPCEMAGTQWGDVASPGDKTGSGMHLREALQAACQALKPWWHPATTLQSTRGQAEKENEFIQVHGNVVDDRNSQKRRIFMEALTSTSPNCPWGATPSIHQKSKQLPQGHKERKTALSFF